MSCYSGCKGSKSTRAILITTVLALVLNEALSDDGKALIGAMLTSVGDLLVTGGTADSVCQPKSNNFSGYY